MSLLEKLKLLFLYDGLTQKEYQSVEPYIIKENNHRLKIYSIIGIVFVLGLSIHFIITSGFGFKTIVCLACTVCNILVLFMLNTKIQYKRIIAKILNYFFTSVMLLFTMYIGGVSDINLPATTFFAAVALIPCITYERIILGLIYRLIILLLFITISFITKNPDYARLDLVNGISVFILSTLAGIYVQKMQIKSWIVTNDMDKEITKMSAIFESIRVIDISSNTFITHSDNNVLNSCMMGTDSATTQIDRYIEEFVSENNKAHMRQFCDLSTLEDRMFNDKILICDYATTDTTWRRAFFVAIEEDSDGFVTKVVFTIQRIADAFYLNMLDFDLEKIK